MVQVVSIQVGTLNALYVYGKFLAEFHCVEIPQYDDEQGVCLPGQPGVVLPMTNVTLLLCI